MPLNAPVAPGPKISQFAGEMGPAAIVGEKVPRRTSPTAAMEVPGGPEMTPAAATATTMVFTPSLMGVYVMVYSPLAADRPLLASMVYCSLAPPLSVIDTFSASCPTRGCPN